MPDSVWPHRQQPTRLPRPWDSPGKNAGVGCHFLLQCMKVKSESEVAQSFPTLSDLMDCSLQGSSVHGIFQARVLEWGATAFSGIYVLHLSKSIDCSTPRVNPNVNYGLWGTVICQCRLIHCNRCSLLVGNVDILGKSECICCGGYMELCTFCLYFLWTWRCPKKNKPIKTITMTRTLDIFPPY